MQPFRKEKTTEIIDDNGSVLTTEVSFRENLPVKPKRRYYEMRYPSTEMKLSDLSEMGTMLMNDNRKLDKCIKLEPTSDPHKYYIVECYTMLEY